MDEAPRGSPEEGKEVVPERLTDQELEILEVRVLRSCSTRKPAHYQKVLSTPN
jgi:hypothetical protein